MYNKLVASVVVDNSIVVKKLSKETLDSIIEYADIDASWKNLPNVEDERLLVVDYYLHFYVPNYESKSINSEDDIVDLVEMMEGILEDEIGIEFN